MEDSSHGRHKFSWMDLIKLGCPCYFQEGDFLSVILFWIYRELAGNSVGLIVLNLMQSTSIRSPHVLA